MSIRQVLPFLPSRRQLHRVVMTPPHVLDPAGWRARRTWRGTMPPGAAFLCIYRPRYVGAVERMVAEATALGMRVALWGLSGESQSLAAHTVGTGPGDRLDLLNELYATLGDSAPGPLVFADDDVEFARGGLAELVGASVRCGFDLAQPAHGPGSFRSYPITFSRHLTLARRVTWIEVGPVVFVGPRWRDRVVPFPSGFGMGWGLELCWNELAQQGCRLGIVDAVTIRHLGLVGLDYDVTRERTRSSALKRERSIGQMETVQQVLGTWRFWRPRPPWDDADLYLHA